MIGNFLSGKFLLSVSDYVQIVLFLYSGLCVTLNEEIFAAFVN